MTATSHRQPDPPPTQRRRNPLARFMIDGIVPGLIALVLLIVAIVFLSIRNGEGSFPWWLLLFSALAIVAGVVLLYQLITRFPSNKSKLAFIVSCVLSIIAMLLAWSSSIERTDDEPELAENVPSVSTPATGSNDPDPDADVDADDPDADPSEDPDQPAVALPPDPANPAYDEVNTPGSGYDGANLLVQLRAAAATLGLPAGEQDFRAPYSEYELGLLRDRQLSWLREHPAHPPAIELARVLGIPDPSGEALADYLQDRAVLEEVGDGGLRVNNFLYQDDAQLAFAQEEVLPAGDLIWTLRDADGDRDLPIVRWLCLNFIVPIDWYESE